MRYLILDDLMFDYGKVSPLRSQIDIRAGILKLRQKIEGYLGIEESYLIIDKSLEELYNERSPEKKVNILPMGDLCIVNARLKIDEAIAAQIDELPNNTKVLADNGEVLVLKYTNEVEAITNAIEFNNSLFEALTVIDKKFKAWESLEEIIDSNAQLLTQDFQDFFYDKDNFFETEQGVTVVNPYNVWVGEDTVLKHGVVVDASNGPVVIDEGAVIGINTTIEGPAYIGKEVVLKASTNIFPNSSIGAKSVISGQIQNSIIQAYCDKPFTGSLNRCYVGEWTKIEAGISIDSDFFNHGEITVIRDLTMSFHFSESSENLICQYQEMRTNKIKAMKFDKNKQLSKIESSILKNYLNEEI